MIRYGTMLAALVVLSLPSMSNAQGLGPDELTRQVNPGIVAPYLGAGHVERYNYNQYMVPMYFYWDSQRFYDLEYEDRLDRWAKFGHRWPSAKRGSDFQLQRIQKEQERRAQVIDESSSRRGRWFGGGVFFGKSRQ